MHSKVIKKLISFLMLLVLSIAVCVGVACKKSEDPEANDEVGTEEETAYALNEPVLDLSVGETFTLSVLNLEEDEPVEWRSLQSNVASVDATGMVSGVTPGETRILTTVDGKTLTCIVTVKIKLDFLPVLELRGMQKQDGEYKLTLMLGDEYALDPVLYLGGEEVETSFTLTSNSEAVVVDGNTVRANAEIQNAEITVSCSYDNQTYSVVCYVSVEEVA